MMMVHLVIFCDILIVYWIRAAHHQMTDLFLVSYWYNLDVTHMYNYRYKQINNIYNRPIIV